MNYRSIFSLLILFVISILLVTCAVAQQTEFTQKILAVVGGQAITQTDVDELLAPIYLQYKNTYKGNDLKQKLDIARADILEQIIEDKLILHEAKRRELTVDEKEVDKLIEDLKQDFSSWEEFEQVLKNQNTSLTELRKRYREQLLIKKAVGKAIISKIIISPGEVADYYEAHKNDFKIPEQIHLRSIFLNVNNNEEEIQKKADDIYAQLEKGTPFVELVEKYSEAPNVVDAGDMGFIKRGSLRAEIENTVFTLKTGAYSKPLKTPAGYYIFKIEGKKEATTSPLENVQENIRRYLFEEKIKVRLKEWIDKLKTTTLIEVKTYGKEKS
ncbi:MAG: SurA N-terminal domain-containing protein [Candidatus Omnitrophica bacterium]|nr:SurA N-terminal domain-containing protein [Candidatus Omnitrophota bacterium]